MRDIIVILCDALRYDHVTPEITPNICEFAEKGIFFTECHSGNTETEMSLPWLLCGQELYSPTSNIMCDLRKYGYKSFLIHSNPVILPFHHGWDDVYYCEPDSSFLRKIKGLYRKNTFVRDLYELIKKIIPIFGARFQLSFFHYFAYSPYSRAEEIFDVARKTLHKPHNIPYFIWIHLMDPHSPYLPRKTMYTPLELEKIHETKPDAGRATKGNNPNIPPPIQEEIDVWKSLYEQEIREMDEIIGEFLSTLNGDEIVIITSDHGEEFGEHGGFGHVAGKFVPELQHVPLIVVDRERTGTYADRFDQENMSFLIQEIAGAKQ